MKIFAWADSPTVDTGFGIVTKNLFNRFHKMGHDVSILGVNEFGDSPRLLSTFPYPIYTVDRGNPEQLYGMRKIWNIIAAEQPDIFFLLNDPWLIENAFQIKPPDASPYTKTVAYYPTDAAPLKPSWHETLNNLDAQVCYSKYAEHVISVSNGGKPKNLHQIYHGVDTAIFKPVNQQMARSTLGLPLEDFIVGMVARNQPRKRFDILMMGFAEFAKDKENVKLYLHTGLHDIGFDILDLARQLKISDKLILTEDIAPNKGVSPQRLNLIYNSFDVNALISLGDGFGLPVAESMATGCPQIVSGHSCLQELVEGHGGLTVKNAAWIMNSGGMNTWGGVSDVADLVKKLDVMYNASPAQRIKYGEEGYNFITQEQLTWDYAADEFIKIFKEICHVL